MSIRMFFILFIIMAFFNDLGIPYMPHKSVPCCIVFVFASLISVLIYKHKTFIKDIEHIARNKHNSLWVYTIFLIFVLAITIIHSLLGRTKPLPSILGVVLQYGVSLLSCYIVAMYASYKLFKPEFLLKLVYTIFYMILLLGLVDFASYILDIEPLQKVLSLCFNVKQISDGVVFIKAYSLGIPRVQSIYFEPGFFAEYTFLMLPILYSLSLSKYKIFQNSKINFIVKKTTIPLVWINLILTQSPIWLVFSLISTAIYFVIKSIIYFKRSVKKALTISAIVCSIAVLSFIPITRVDLSQTYLSRIVTVIETLKDINILIMAEESLGTRLSNIINLLDIGSKHIVMGIGHSNLVPAMEKQILNGKSPVAVTSEMIMCESAKNPALQNPPLTNILVRYGIIALLLYYAFIIKTILALKKCLKYTSGNRQYFILGLLGTLCSYIVISCYDIVIANLLSATLIGLAIGLVQYVANDCYYLMSKGDQAYE